VGVGASEAGDRVLDMEVSARGSNISGGFAQSIALARVFLRTQSRVLILDEATSQMDAIKKRDIVMPNVARFVRDNGMALVLISHDLARIQHVDCIYVLDKGHLVGKGSHQELVNSAVPAYLQLLGSA